MDFLSAVTALKEGKCEGIRSSGPFGSEKNYLILYECGKTSPCLAWNTGVGETDVPLDYYLLADWQLVNETPVMETVTEKIHVGLHPDGRTFLRPETWCSDYPLVDGVLTYQRPVAPKVKHRVQVFGFTGHFAGTTSGPPKGANIYAEWETP